MSVNDTLITRSVHKNASIVASLLTLLDGVKRSGSGKDVAHQADIDAIAVVNMQAPEAALN